MTETTIQHDQANTDNTADGVSDFERFCRDALSVYACPWIDRCQTAIARHAREIFQDATLRSLVERYAEERRGADKSGTHEFVRACSGAYADNVDNEGEIHHARAVAYKTVLDDLIWERWCRNA